MAEDEDTATVFSVIDHNVVLFAVDDEGGVWWQHYGKLVQANKPHWFRRLLHLIFGTRRGTHPARHTGK